MGGASAHKTHNADGARSLSKYSREAVHEARIVWSEVEPVKSAALPLLKDLGLGYKVWAKSATLLVTRRWKIPKALHVIKKLGGKRGGLKEGTNGDVASGIPSS